MDKRRGRGNKDWIGGIGRARDRGWWNWEEDGQGEERLVSRSAGK